MSGCLLDTSSLSKLAPGREPLAAKIVDGLRRHSSAMYLPTIALAEIHAGICKLRRLGGTQKADALERWIDALGDGFADRALSFDTAAAERAGSLADAARAAGRHPGFADVAIAGIALARHLTIVTENTRHFVPLGVDVVDLAGLS